MTKQRTTLPRTLLARSVHVARRLGIVYINNPKVASSTIKLALQRAEMGDPDWTPETSVHDRKATALLTYPELSVEDAPAALRGRYVFSFVRNPYVRLQSAYMNKIVWNHAQGRLREAAGFAADTCPSFEDFVLAICAQPDAQHNPHWRLQAINLSMDTIAYDFIGRLEDFAMDWAWMAGRLDLPFRPERAGKGTGQQYKEQLCFTPEMQAAVLDKYLPDFNHFGYAPDSLG
ncbi:sulfotransferase family protein [Tropicibacter naphthalenivorans]|uniref:Sulfotransferase family protein n=1 Tax=Tropicibacter naphthalenivorans TaxID=441103 RepID=A0A0P1GKF1_9RHOB|nr:sulfotransferase family protein [Tropicibacter naphthalenivorans]CUH82629.1 Sulfotransferase family protein [Tropicibacter naphthalenivorans]SMD08973.1 Sulfotransferase family protein [Tropicibacter naphthalenivorans]